MLAMLKLKRTCIYHNNAEVHCDDHDDSGTAVVHAAEYMMMFMIVKHKNAKVHTDSMGADCEVHDSNGVNGEPALYD